MKKKYQPAKEEAKIYQRWQRNHAFRPRRDKRLTPFSIIMPPPNANAPLHIGHAMFITLEDIMVRYHRMQGNSSLWLPGADHAGILTQVVFERQLAKQGKTRFDLGRHKFFQECKKFTQKNKKIMFDQLKKVGASCNWQRQKFTLDQKISQQVLLTFVNLYQDRLAYRGLRLINWCPRCMTALSDLEIEYQPKKEILYYLKYPLKIHSRITGQKRFLVVATTRPETMLADTALAVHPKDKRYQKFIGQTAVLPLVGRKIPVLADKMVDPEFGTGVVKITPGHDSADYQVGKKHQLSAFSVIGFDGRMNEKAGKGFAGLTLKEARKKILDCLRKKEYLIKEKKLSHSTAHCERCKSKIEPLLSQQWFIRTNKKISLPKQAQKLFGKKRLSLAEMGILAVEKKLIKILPKKFEKNYLRWLKNLHDWCVSRQLWWGHQIPVWYCGYKGLSALQKQMNPQLVKRSRPGCGQAVVSLEKPKSCPRCRRRTAFVRDPDTFDCWFSSGQWPYTTLGFPQQKDYQYFYPTSVMETGYEILYLWVSRMIMLGLYRTSQVPFKTVYLHGMVRDAFGQKMSKSRGNVINPLKVVEKYGADALRMALVVGSTPGNDVSVSDGKIKGYRNFANKVWNIGRFVLMGLQSTRKRIPWYQKSLQPKLTKADQQIIKELNELVKEVSQKLDNFEFSPAGQAIYHFLWERFANEYLETNKARVKEKDVLVLSVLRHVFLKSLKLLHPFMPFISEAVWQEFPDYYKKEKELITASWPES